MHRFAILIAVVFLAAGCTQSPPPAAPTPPPPAGGAGVTPAPSGPTQPPVATAPPMQTPPQQSPPATGVPGTTPAPTVPDLIAQAQQAGGSRNFDEGIRLLEQAIAQEPSNRQVLSMLTEFTQMNGMLLTQRGANETGYAAFEKSAEYLRKLLAAGPLNSREKQLASHVHYNEACALALKNEGAKAVTALEAAVKAGFDNLEHIDTDSDLNSIREMPEFKAFRENAPAILLARAKEHAQELISQHQPFDFDFSLPDLEGKTVSLADYKGKLLIVDVWGTWCPPCRKEVPHFVDLHKKYRDAGLEIVGINYERVPQERMVETIKKFVDDNGVTYACLIGDNATQQKIPDFNAFPTTLFVDRTGKVRLKVVGYHSLQNLEGIVSLLLAEGGGVPAAN